MIDNDTQKQIDRLNTIITNPASSKVSVETAKKQLSRLESMGNVQVIGQQAGVTLDPNAQAILDGLNKALSKGYTSSVDIRTEIEEVLKIRKITENDLSDSLRALLNSTRKLELTITQISGNVSRTTTSDKFLTLDLINSFTLSPSQCSRVHRAAGLCV